MQLLVLNRHEIADLLSMQKCIDLMQDALASLARGEVILPLRPVMRIPDSRNVFALMPAYSRTLEAFGTKLISVFPENHGAGVDSHQGAVVLFDGTNGSPLAVMDAASITAIRTAAVSGVATRLLANADARTLAILGSGVQGRTHIDAMLAAHPFSKVLIWSRDPSHARALVDEVAWRHRAQFDIADSSESAVRAADVVCTVTASREPVLRGQWLGPGVHINAVGASMPSNRELDSEAVRRARLFVDRRESALSEAGDILIPIGEGAITADHIAAELGEVLVGSAQGRLQRDDTTLFKSLGLAIEDIACAHYLYSRAREEDTGTWIEF